MKFYRINNFNFNSECYVIHKFNVGCYLSIELKIVLSGETTSSEQQVLNNEEEMRSIQIKYMILYRLSKYNEYQQIAGKESNLSRLNL